MLGLIGEMDRNRFAIFRSLTLLRQLSLAPGLIDEKYADVRSSKVDALVEQLDEVVREGHRALVFSQFTGFLDIGPRPARRGGSRLLLPGRPHPQPGRCRSTGSRVALRRCSSSA